MTDPYRRILGQRERYVLQRRRAGDTYQQIGSDIGLTRERVKQVERNAARRLTAHPLRPDPSRRPAEWDTPQEFYERERFGELSEGDRGEAFAGLTA